MVQFSIDMPNLKTLKVMVSNSDLLFQENENLHIVRAKYDALYTKYSALDTKYSALYAENIALHTENSALQSKVNNQNTCAVCGKDSGSSTVSDQVHVIVSINGAFMCSVVTEDVFF